jgi:hypothetical protein
MKVKVFQAGVWGICGVMVGSCCLMVDGDGVRPAP